MPKPMPLREVPKPKNEKYNNPIPVWEWLKKHVAIEAQMRDKSSMKDKGKVVDVESK